MKPDIDAIKERVDALVKERHREGCPNKPIAELLEKELIADGYTDEAAVVYANSQTDLLALLAYIEQLEAALSAKESVNRLYGATVDIIGSDKAEAIRRMEKAEARARELEAERDAAVEDIKQSRICALCKRDEDGTCGDYEGCNFEWRGVQGRTTDASDISSQ